MNPRSRAFKCILTFAFFIPAVTARAAPLNDTIIAIVNSEAITLKDLRDYIGGIYRQLKVENKSAQEINEIMVPYEQKGLEIRQEAVNKRLKEIRDRYSNEDAFVAALSTQGMTITDLKNKAINQMKA